MHRLLLFSALLAVAHLCNAQVAHMGCSSSTYVYGPPNPYEIYNPTNMQLLNTTVNGTSYIVNVPLDGHETSQSFYITHVWGSPYQQGYAFGSLLGPQCKQFVDSAYQYIAGQIEVVLFPYLPDWLVVMIVDIGLDAALDFVYDITVDYTSPDFYDEMQGLCDASGADYLKTRRLHMLPGLTKGACSMFGAWGSAVPKGGSLLQLRALDWDMDGPFRDFSSITVYHPDPSDPSQGHAWVNVGFVGFIGALTGMSEKQMGISEIGVSFPDGSWGPPQDLAPIPGTPFIVVLRDILKYDETLDDSIMRMAQTTRTCNLILGVGDGKVGQFRSFQYGPYVFNVFNDENLQPVADWHPRMDDVVYHGMDWECPSFNTVLHSQLDMYYGQITPENAVHNISAAEQSGTNHLAFYDLTLMDMYVAFAAPHASTGPLNAYDRQFVQLDLDSLFSEPAPSVSSD